MVRVNSQSQTESHGDIRSRSLADFDPFSPIFHGRKSNPSTSSPSHSIPTSPLVVSEQVKGDLRIIAGELQKDSLQVASDGRRASFSSSPRDSKSKSGSAASTTATPISPKNVKKWNKPKKVFSTLLHPFSKIHVSPGSRGGLTDGTNRRHRRAQSLAKNASVWKDVQEEVSVVESSVADSPIDSSTTAQLQPNAVAKELETSFREEPEKSERIKELFIPDLAKPRPTSLLKKEDDVNRTSEFDPSSFQLALPDRQDVLVATRAVHFLESYRLHELIMDLSTLRGFSKTELQSFAAGSQESCKSLSSCHRAVVEGLIDCCPDLLEVKGYFKSDDNEVLVIERQKNQILTVFHVAEACGKQQALVLKNHRDVTIAREYFEILHGISSRLFARLDELTEESPFSDILFAGHGTGAGLAILESYLYATTRTSQRVAAYVTAAPKVGMEDFRMAVHSQPNLLVTRIDSQDQRGNQSFCHVGNCIRLHQGADKLWNAKAFKFAPDAKASGLRSLLFQKQPLTEEYVEMLENAKTWPKEFHAQDIGDGVKRENDEKRTMT